ncbi:MAG: FAD-dependent oxidoreductase [Alphaproteobacteria bacterium]|nr:FAD-dependent oxidoreductase [Alphaproteobacteria bacterium]MBV9862777.1 FAD-dependent oxidoreductase [Alphaproteobacteria bacterium]
MSNATIDTSVLVVGAGPVGLTLAIDLAWRGIEVVVVERRHRGEPPPPKCNHTSARSMEIFRRLGVARRLRDAGLPADYPNDCAFRTTMTGIELARIPIPCRRDRYAATDGPDTWWPTPEPPHRINQIYLEPVLAEFAAAMPRLHLLWRTEIEDFAPNDDGVRATARDLDSGAPQTIDCRYLVGCDGGRSTIRRRIGAVFHGTPVVQRVQSTFIRAPQLLSLVRGRPAWVNIALNPRRSGNVMAIDGHQKWIIFNYLHEDESDFDAVDRDWAIRAILGVGPDFTYEVLSTEDWVGRRLVADKFRDGRVFLCGDAAHIWVPYAGYGMNAGIADAANLAWLLAATLQGWAPSAILDAYEKERLPITEQVSHFAMNHAQAMIGQRRSVPAEIDDSGPAGEAARAALGRAAYDLNVRQYCCGGLNFGYFYAGSPIIAYDGESPPPYTMDSFTPSTVPGCRTPHLWLRDGRSLYDALGPDYTLLRLDPKTDAAPLMAAAAERCLPLKLLDVAAPDAAALYDRKLVLSRPDQHVAWRGDELPADPAALIDLIRGAGSSMTR